MSIGIVKSTPTLGGHAKRLAKPSIALQIVVLYFSHSDYYYTKLFETLWSDPRIYFSLYKFSGLQLFTLEYINTMFTHYIFKTMQMWNDAVHVQKKYSKGMSSSIVSAVDAPCNTYPGLAP